MAAEDCPECIESKTTAATRAAASEGRERDGLQLGDCTAIYKKWTDCIAQSGNQTSECSAIAKEFKACHSAKGKAR
jgi:hypothetical protein